MVRRIIFILGRIQGDDPEDNFYPREDTGR